MFELPIRDAVAVDEVETSEKFKGTDLDDIRSKITLWKTPLVQIIDDGVWINDHLVWKNGSYFDVDGNHWLE